MVGSKVASSALVTGSAIRPGNPIDELGKWLEACTTHEIVVGRISDTLMTGSTIAPPARGNPIDELGKWLEVVGR